jgi:glycosyltransferase involved in cell wall biosynthesis
VVIARRLEAGNGLTTALKAFAMIKTKYPRAELTIMGDGPQREALERLAADERIFGVTFTGEVSHEEVAGRMAEADVFLNASTMDGLPLSLLEAMASGLIAVTTDAGDIPAVVCDRYNGLIARSNSAAALADRMIELVEDPELATRLSAEAARSAVQTQAGAAAGGSERVA